MPYQVSMMGWVGSDEDLCVRLGPYILGWVGFWKSDPWPLWTNQGRGYYVRGNHYFQNAWFVCRQLSIIVNCRDGF